MCEENMSIRPNILSEICAQDDDKIIAFYVRTHDSVLASEHLSGKLHLLVTPYEDWAKEMIVYYKAPVETSIISTTNLTGMHAIIEEYGLDGANIWSPTQETQMVLNKNPQNS